MDDPRAPHPAPEVPARQRWDSRYRTSAPTFVPHPLAAEACAAGLPDGAVLEPACGRSGSALALAAAGRRVVAVDVSAVALDQLGTEAARRGLSGRVTAVRADLVRWARHGDRAGPSPDAGHADVPRGPFAFVLATLFWDEAVFRVARRAVARGGILGWEALTADGPRRYRVRHGDLAAAVPPGWRVLAETLVDDGRRRTTRLLARRER